MSRPKRPEHAITVETKVAFLERTVDALNEALVEQGRVIERFERRLERLEQRVAAKSEPDIEPHDTPPPHY